VTSCIYSGEVMHCRTAPVRHTFRYPIALFALDLDELTELDRRLRCFSVNGRNLIGFHDRDHMDRRPGSTKTKVLAFLRAHDIDLDGGTITLLTQCRMFGYVFNPVSFYYCHRPSGDLHCIVAEVNNTFGERYLYLLSHDQDADDVAGRYRRYTARKVMHVSPFISMQARYEFRFAPVGDRLSVFMTESAHGQRFFAAHLRGRRTELSDRTLLWLVATHPFLTLKIIGAIHWQAVRLYLKGAPFHRQPAASPEQVEQEQWMHNMAKEFGR
jgi:uncharacterized protein